MALDRDRVLQLLEILKSSTAAELSVTEGDTTIRLARPLAPVCTPAAEPAAAAAQPEAPADPVTVKARVVGLFYRGKDPGQAPLVNVGDEVKQGQRLGIIEVLRKPTDVNSPVHGTVTAVRSEDGAGVQYGDPLFDIAP